MKRMCPKTASVLPAMITNPIERNEEQKKK
nr:MAG TPA: hypothetical protein [Bacteriophage sp.]